MKIELQEPYKSHFKPFGTVSKMSSGRRIIYFTKLDGVQTGTSYARYLMAVKLGHFIADDLEVDHIDNDFTNDNIDNLQVLTSEQNLKKYHKHYKENIQQYYELTCAKCYKKYIVEQKDYTKTLVNTNTYCSKKCLGLSQMISSDIIDEINILANTGVSNEQIARKYKLDSTIVAKHRVIPPTTGTGVNLSKDTISEIIRLSLTGNSDISIARDLNISPTAVNRHRTIPSSTNKGKSISDDMKLDIKRLYEKGLTQAKIAKELSISIGTVVKYL